MQPLPERRDGLPDRLGILGLVRQQAKLDGQRDELLLRAVVQVPLDLAPLGILGLDQPAP